MRGGALGETAVWAKGKEKEALTGKPSHQKRIYAFDLIESIAIIMACSLHYPLFAAGSYIAEFWQLLCIGAVPAFFMVNGCLLFSRPFDGRKHKRKIVNIVLGLLFWKTAILVIFFAMGLIDGSFFIVDNIILYYFTANKVGILPTEHMWFMYALLTIYILYPFFREVFDSGKKRYIRWMCIFGFVMIPGLVDLSWSVSALGQLFGANVSINLVSVEEALFPFGNWGWYFIFFLLGPVVWGWISRLQSSFSKRKTLLFSIAILCFGVAIAYIQDYVYQGTGSWTGFVIPFQYQHFVTVIVGVGLMALCASLSPQNALARRFVKTVSENTLTIYYAHMPIILLLSIFLPMHSGFAVSIFRVLVVAGLAVALGSLMKRIPFLKRIS